MENEKINTSKVIVRKIRQDEIPQAIKIAMDTLTENYSYEIFYSIYNSWPEGFIVAEYEKNIVGFIASSRQSIYEARILMFSVMDVFQNMGIGSLLLKKFEEICKLNGIRAIRLEVRISNKNAIIFYEKRGFIIINLINNYYSNGEAAYIMWKMLEN
ncbi:MAG: N-acetyltransferase [Thermoplasmata archaeon]|jgi:ribosomal-protein-alanine N-acetyltransferase|nr:GNAT family N-acetyltransferase [Thermoplasmata archaeon]MVT13258.1 GNAT family N-acetyltransferase [Euryarchaeota archaeon]MVT14739.1 GNAT family N-acetyltransferase [Euryarchaeota archaeon]MVT35979.1 GNAT family N-acetyltransferase [Euryarchaeota archaeon]